MATKISQRAIDLIIEFEVSSKSYYQKVLQKPEWPGLASGVTVGIGYDLGYNSPNDIQKDWGDVLSPETVAAMKKYSGITGENARGMLAQARREIVVPWEAAIKVFGEKTTPKWIDMVIKALPNTDAINEDCLGALVSLAYNRGTSFSKAGDRYREMRNIKSHMKSKNFDFIPGEFRDMKRLWPGTRGLLLRRDKEAKLFDDGLKAGIDKNISKPVAPTPVPTPVPTPEPPKTWWSSVTGWFTKT